MARDQGNRRLFSPHKAVGIVRGWKLLDLNQLLLYAICIDFRIRASSASDTLYSEKTSASSLLRAWPASLVVFGENFCLFHGSGVANVDALERLERLPN